jgi:hypothetical protein
VREPEDITPHAQRFWRGRTRVQSAGTQASHEVDAGKDGMMELQQQAASVTVFRELLQLSVLLSVGMLSRALLGT